VLRLVLARPSTHRACAVLFYIAVGLRIPSPAVSGADSFLPQILPDMTQEQRSSHHLVGCGLGYARGSCSSTWQSLGRRPVSLLLLCRRLRTDSLASRVLDAFRAAAEPSLHLAAGVVRVHVLRCPYV